MKIRMLTTENGSIDGIRVQSYEAETVHDLSDTAGGRDLAAAFVGAGMAVEVAGETLAVATPVAPVTAQPVPERQLGRKKKQ